MCEGMGLQFVCADMTSLGNFMMAFYRKNGFSVLKSRHREAFKMGVRFWVPKIPSHMNT